MDDMTPETDEAESGATEATEQEAGSAIGNAMLVDLTPGALACGTVDGEMETFESIGELLDYLLRRYRMAERPDDPTGDFMAGYEDDAGLAPRQATASDSASARRA